MIGVDVHTVPCPHRCGAQVLDLVNTAGSRRVLDPPIIAGGMFLVDDTGRVQRRAIRSVLGEQREGAPIYGGGHDMHACYTHDVTTPRHRPQHEPMVQRGRPDADRYR